MAEIPRAQFVDLIVSVKQRDDSGRIVKEIVINKTIPVNMHRSTDHRVLEMNAAVYEAFARLHTGAVAGSMTTPAVVMAYSPDKPIRFAINPSADETTIAEFDSYDAFAPTGHLLLIANLDGDDTGFDHLDFANPNSDSGANTNDAHPVVLVSGD